uniref:Uncharacterized protein n=1 Tax=Kalanchoe fedtschenkoi TaxID=63787 RepID=A0A7N0UN65_KALFE
MAASATIQAAGVASSGVLSADALPVIDLRGFTQSELRALAKSSSNSAAEASRLGEGDDGVPVPKIDRAVFNESAGSRKQTYSRLRLAPRKPVEAKSRRIGEVRVEMDEVENWENRKIVGMLKELIGEGGGEWEVFEGLVTVEVECDPELRVPNVELVRQPVQVDVGVVSPLRRKRGRPRKDSESVSVSKIVLYDSEDGDGDGFVGEKLDVSEEKRYGDDKEMVNRNGEVVDLVALGNVDDPFGPELRRRTEGMSTKEQLLEFLTGLGGHWMSRRRKRKIIDASEFGDALPRGWKLMFLIKKKAGHAWLICRRYISPCGRKFTSCKEVSSYLKYLSGIQIEEQKISICNKENVTPMEEIPIDNVQYTSEMQSEEQNISICNDENVIPVEKSRRDNVVNRVVQDDVMPYHHHPSESQVPNLSTQVEPESGITFLEMAKDDHSPQISPSSPKRNPETEIPFSEMAKNDYSPQILSSSPARNPESVYSEMAKNDHSPQVILSSPKRKPERENLFSEMAKNDHSPQILPSSPKKKPAIEIPFSEMAKNYQSLQILPSSPKGKAKRRKLGTLVSDGVIMKDGKFECQFCHKTFDERRRYTSHVGVHVRSAAEALRGKGTKPAGTNLGSASEALPVASGLDVSVTATSYSRPQENSHDAASNDAMKLESLHANLLDGSQVEDCTGKRNIEMSLENMELGHNVNHEALFGISYDKSDGDCEIADDALLKLDESELNHSAPQTKFVQSGFNELCEGNRISVSDFKTLGGDGNSKKSTVVYNEARKESGDIEKNNGDSASFGVKLTTDVEGIHPAGCADKTFNAYNNPGGLVSNSNKEHTIDFTEQFSNERSPFNLGMVDSEQEDVCAFYQQRSKGSSPVASFLNEQGHNSISSKNEAAVSKLMEYKCISEKDSPNSGSNKQVFTVNKDFLNGMSGISSKPVCIDESNSGIQPVVVSTSNRASTHDENDWSQDTRQKIFGVTYMFPSLNPQQGANNIEATSADVTGKSPWKSPACNPQPAVSSVDRASNVMASKEFWKAADDSTNSDVKIVNEAPMGVDVLSGLEHVKGSSGYSFSSIGNEQGFSIRNDMVGMGDNSMQERRPEKDYVSDFANPFENGQSNQANNTKMFPTRPMEQSKVDEVRFPLNSELKISLGNNQTRLEAANSNLKGQSLVLSGNEQFGLQNSHNAFYSSSVEEPSNQSARGLFDQFGQRELFGIQNNVNQAYNGSTWVEQRIGSVGNFGPDDLVTGFSSQPQRSENVLAGFGSSQPQFSENVLAGFGGSQPQSSENMLAEANWRLGASARGLNDASLSRDQPSGYFHNLQMTTSKGDNQFYAVPQKLNNLGDFQDQRGGIQQREYNFLNAQAKPYAREASVTPYQQQMPQSYDSASWLGRQVSVPEMPARNQPAASCVWCSNMFYLESLNSFNQADTIVPTCPSCKGKMSEQLNLF